MGLFGKAKKDIQAASGAFCPHCNAILDPDYNSIAYQSPTGQCSSYSLVLYNTNKKSY